jgi:hypothetical protein
MTLGLLRRASCRALTSAGAALATGQCRTHEARPVQVWTRSNLQDMSLTWLRQCAGLAAQVGTPTGATVLMYDNGNTLHSLFGLHPHRGANSKESLAPFDFQRLRSLKRSLETLQRLLGH